MRASMRKLLAAGCLLLTAWLLSASPGLHRHPDRADAAPPGHRHGGTQVEAVVPAHHLPACFLCGSAPGSVLGPPPAPAASRASADLRTAAPPADRAVSLLVGRPDVARAPPIPPSCA